VRALPEIDYDAHPAYRALHVESPGGEQELTRLSLVLGRKREWLARSAEVFARRASAGSDQASEALARDGALGVRVGADLLDPVRAAAGPFIEALDALHARRRIKGKPLGFKHTQTDLFAYGQWTSAAGALAGPIEALLNGCGVYDSAAAYYRGCSASLSSVCVRQNVEDQPFFSLGEDRQTPKTMGMHIDSAGNATFNGVIYLSEVGPEQGPFRYVAGSNHWDWEIEDRAIRKAVDEMGYAPGRDGTFLELPPHLRRRGNFGGDLLDDEPASQSLLSLEKTFCSDACDMVLFDSDGVHRGGDVRTGHRASILFLMRVEPNEDLAGHVQALNGP
jgi:hypothetical protein